MMPANRIFIASFGVRGSTCAVPCTTERRTTHLARRTTHDEPRTTALVSPFRRLDQLIDRLGIIERFADRESGTHPPVQIALRQQLVVPPFRGDATAVEHQNAVRVADRREPVGDDNRRATRSKV